MKKAILFLFFILSTVHSFSQFKLEIEGESLLKGRLSLQNHSTDVTSLSIGIGTGLNKTENTLYQNTFIGWNAGFFNDIGNSNTFIGSQAGRNNIDGHSNVFIGMRTGQSNKSGGLNVFVGQNAGADNTDGHRNTFIGWNTGPNNTIGLYNTFIGQLAGGQNLIGNFNTNIGARAGQLNESGSENVFIGMDSGTENISGNYNVFIGNRSNSISPIDSNVVAIGHSAIVNKSNKIRLGNTSISEIEGQVNYSTVSDKRLKKRIKNNQLGLDFIKSIRTVSYQMKDGHEGIYYTGFLAQDIEKILNKSEQNFSGLIKPRNDKDYYSLRYAEFVVPLTKAVQEQQALIDDLENENKEFKEMFLRQQQDINALKTIINQLSENSPINTVTNPVVLKTNPNPFGESAQIIYKIPNIFLSASIQIFTLNGQLVDTFELDTNKGEVVFHRGNRTGSFRVLLIADGKILQNIQIQALE